LCELRLNLTASLSGKARGLAVHRLPNRERPLPKSAEHLRVRVAMLVVPIKNLNVIKK
jgi:hypothetical protein